MSHVQPSHIDSLDSLCESMKTQECSVEWTVYPEIGPGWIGGAQEICFYLGEQEIGDYFFHDQLKAALMNLVKIPDLLHDHIMEGEGDVKFTDGRLYLEYSWSITPLYSYPIASHSGEGELVLAHK